MRQAHGVDACAGVGHGDIDVLSGRQIEPVVGHGFADFNRAGCNCDDSGIVDGVAGVDDKVGDDLKQLAGVDKYSGWKRFELLFEPDAFPKQLPQHGQKVFELLVGAQGARFHFLLTGETE